MNIGQTFRHLNGIVTLHFIENKAYHRFQIIFNDYRSLLSNPESKFIEAFTPIWTYVKWLWVKEGTWMIKTAGYSWYQRVTIVESAVSSILKWATYFSVQIICCLFTNAVCRILTLNSNIIRPAAGRTWRTARGGARRSRTVWHTRDKGGHVARRLTRHRNRILKIQVCISFKRRIQCHIWKQYDLIAQESSGWTEIQFTCRIINVSADWFPLPLPPPC